MTRDWGRGVRKRSDEKNRMREREAATGASVDWVSGYSA